MHRMFRPQHDRAWQAAENQPWHWTCLAPCKATLTVSPSPVFRLPTIFLFTFGSSVNFSHEKFCPRSDDERWEEKGFPRSSFGIPRKSSRHKWLKKMPPAISETSGSRNAFNCYPNTSGKAWGKIRICLSGSCQYESGGSGFRQRSRQRSGYIWRTFSGDQSALRRFGRADSYPSRYDTVFVKKRLAAAVSRCFSRLCRTCAMLLGGAPDKIPFAPYIKKHVVKLSDRAGHRTLLLESVGKDARRTWRSRAA